MKSFFPLLASFVLLGLAGCNVLPEQQTDAVRYFTLSSPIPVSPSVEGAKVRPVQLAGHLRNRAMAVRVAENEVIYLDDIRWAEPLGDAVTRLLRSRLAPIASDSVISIEVQRCEVVRFENNAVQLVASYAVLPVGAATETKRGVFTSSPRTWDGKDYGSLVNELRDAVGELGDAIAANVPEKK